MKQVRVARRYALALMGLAEEQGQLDRISEDLQFLQNTIRDSREFLLFLKSPVVKSGKKKLVLEELFAGKIHASTQAFLKLLAAKGREDCLDQILAEFSRLRDEKLGIVRLDVKGAVELTGEQNDTLSRTFQRVTKKNVHVSFTLDKALKGGFIAKVGDTVFDASVRRQLELLRERFAHGVGSN
jgi:F-type H+-transporting ATPase subunit delta